MTYLEETCRPMTYLELIQEDQDYEFNAQYDYVREAYGPTGEGLADDEHDDQPPYLTPIIGGVRVIPSYEFRLCECAEATGLGIRHEGF